MTPQPNQVQVVAGAPAFEWLRPAQRYDHDVAALVIDAGAQTDWFIDPAGAPASADAPLLLAPAQAPVTLRAQVRTAAPQTFDAGTLFVWCSDTQWAKFAVERSPQGVLTLVSVVTDRTSDDANHHPVPEDGLHLRVSVLDGGAYAFHASPDARVWSLIRYFRLEGSPRVGFGVQSPTGPGCSATFEDIVWSTAVPADLRDGS